MRYVILTLAIFVLLVFQAGFLANLGMGPAGNLLVLFATVSVILANDYESLFVALACGLLMDLASASRDGTMLVCFLAVFGFTQFFVSKLVPRDANRLVLLSGALINTVLFALVFTFINLMFSKFHLDARVDANFVLGKKLLLDLAVNLIFVYPMFVLYNYLYRIEKAAHEYI